MKAFQPFFEDRLIGENQLIAECSGFPERIEILAEFAQHDN